jgi:hypothetical protein
MGIAVLVLITASAILFFRDVSLSSWDFRNNLYAPTRLLVIGESPYAIRALLGEQGTPNAIWMPMVVGAFFPLGYLNEAQATAWWAMLTVVAYLLVLFLVIPPRPKPLRLLFALLAALLFPPLFGHVALGQFSVIAMALLLMMTFQLNRLWLLVLLIVIAAGKPQLIVLPLTGFTVYLFRTHGIAGIIKFALYSLTAIFLLAFWLLSPGWFEDFIYNLRNNALWEHPSLFIWLRLQIGDSALVIWVISALGILIINSLFWLRYPPKVAMLWSLAFNAFLIPYVWSWDFVLLIPLLVHTIFTVKTARQQAILVIGYSVFWVIFVYLRTQTSNNDLFYWWVPAFFLMLIGLVNFKNLKRLNLTE